ncbi:MAG TPA: STAS/SEC14 domain-containing protein [Lacunisphaera sp.]|nr:STAS/SEC14 domain-containing protein [Lacunisphaera sp.]
MPIKITEENGGKTVIIQVTGKLVRADYEQIGPELDRLVQAHGRLRLMFDMVEFHGWDAGAAWADAKLSLVHFAHIERLALVGETQWQHTLAKLARPFTRAKVRYFDRADYDTASAWLNEHAPAESMR